MNNQNDNILNINTCPSCNTSRNYNNSRYATLNLICDECLQTYPKLDNGYIIKITSKQNGSNLLIVSNENDTFLYESTLVKFTLNGINCLAFGTIIDEIICHSTHNNNSQVIYGFNEKTNFDGNDIRVFTYPVDSNGVDILFEGKKTMKWVNARPYQVNAFTQFKQNKEQDLYYNSRGYKFHIKRTDPNSGIHFIRTDGTKCNIADFNSVKIFLIDHPSGIPNWYRARDYQIWAFLDFIYDNKKSKTYKTLNIPNHQESDVALTLTIYKENGTVDNSKYEFTIFRSDNGNIYFQPVDGRKLRISDNSNEFDCYQKHIEQDYPAIAFTSGTLEEQEFSYETIKSVSTFETVDESKLNVCIVCLKNLWNVIVLSCGHIQICSECLSIESQKHNKCPYCRTDITSFAKLTRKAIENAFGMSDFRKEEALNAADDLNQILITGIQQTVFNDMSELAVSGNSYLTCRD
jgi:hypothetical protein